MRLSKKGSLFLHFLFTSKHWLNRFWRGLNSYFWLSNFYKKRLPFLGNNLINKPWRGWHVSQPFWPHGCVEAIVHLMAQNYFIIFRVFCKPLQRSSDIRLLLFLKISQCFIHRFDLAVDGLVTARHQKHVAFCAQDKSVTCLFHLCQKLLGKLVDSFFRDLCVGKKFFRGQVPVDNGLRIDISYISNPWKNIFRFLSWENMSFLYHPAIDRIFFKGFSVSVSNI